jgi:hypothetical protein
MPIEFDLKTCITIIEVTGLKPISAAAASELAAALNQATANMLQRFERAPVSNTKALREDNRTLQRAVEWVRQRIGFPRSNRDMGAIPPAWASVILEFSKRPGGPSSAEVNKNMRRLAHSLAWLRAEAEALEKFKNHGTPDNRKAAVIAFCHDMLMAYEALFGRHPGVSQSKEGVQPIGPAVRFLPAVLEQLRKKLAESGLHDAANDGALRLTPHMIAGRIRAYSR